MSSTLLSLFSRISDPLWFLNIHPSEDLGSKPDIFMTSDSKPPARGNATTPPSQGGPLCQHP